MVPPVKNIYEPAKPMTDEEAEKIAADIVEKSKSPFHTTEITGWIKTALIEAHSRGSKAEHDKIEQFIGTRTFQQVRAMVERCKFKWGKR